MARKSGDSWYLAGINGQDTTKTVAMHLPFLQPGEHGTLITDSDSQLPFMKKEVTVPLDRMFKIRLHRNGGFVIVWRPK